MRRILIRAKLQIKPEMREKLELVLDEGDWSVAKHPTLTRYENHYGGQIPFAPTMYQPRSWEWTPGSPYYTYDPKMPETGEWGFTSSVMDEGEVEHFLFTIIPIIAESSSWIEKLYSDEAQSQLFELVGGKVIPSKEVGPVYEDMKGTEE